MKGAVWAEMCLGGGVGRRTLTQVGTCDVPG